MSKACGSILNGLREIEAHEKGRIILKTTVLVVEPATRCKAKAIKRIRRT